MKCPLCSSPRPQSWVEIKSPAEALYWACSECKLIWLDETQRPTREVELERYRSHHNEPANPEYIAYLSRLALPTVEKLRPGADGLDFGCGPTEGMKALLSPLGFSVASYDPYFFPDNGLLNFRYDFLLCSEAVEHFFQPGLELERWATLVKPGGRLGVSSALAPEDPLAFAQWWYRRDPTHVVFFRRETVAWAARRWGWELARLESPIWILRKL